MGGTGRRCAGLGLGLTRSVEILNISGRSPSKYESRKDDYEIQTCCSVGRAPVRGSCCSGVCTGSASRSISGTVPTIPMGRGIGITARAGIGPRAIGRGVTIIASGFPVTTRPGIIIVIIIGIIKRCRIQPWDLQLALRVNDSSGPSFFSGLPVTPWRCSDEGVAGRNPQFFINP